MEMKQIARAPLVAVAASTSLVASSDAPAAAPGPVTSNGAPPLSSSLSLLAYYHHR
jgi:hypothetical protein